MDILRVLQIAIGIGLLIFVHELGHYLAARLAGVRVDVFSLGFGPRLFGFRRGSTDYRISIVPVGGYVAVAGDGPVDPRYASPDADWLSSKGFGARTLFFSGGVVMNLVFALIAFPIAFQFGVPVEAPVVGSVDPGGGAWQAGLEPGDRILEVDGKPIQSFRSVRVETALAGGNDPIPFLIERDGEQLTLDVTPIYLEGIGLYDLGANRSVADVPLRINKLKSGSPAARAGLKRGDKLVAIDGERLVGLPADRALQNIQSGEAREIVLTVQRDGDEAEIEVKFRPDPAKGKPRVGVVPTPDHVAAVRPVPVVEALDLRVGDRLLTVDGERYDPTSETPFAASSMTETPDELLLTVLRGDELITLRAPGSAENREALENNVAFRSKQDDLRLTPMPDTPAALAGMQTGDRLLRINGEEIDDWDALVEAVREAAAGKEPKAARLLIERTTIAGDALEKVERELLVTPAPPELLELGFDRELTPLREDLRVDSTVGALRAGVVASIEMVKQIYVTLKRMFTGDLSSRNLSGIVGISQASYSEASVGWVRFLYFLGLLSINLAFVNLLPIPVLDGGHLLFLLIEKIKGSPVSAEVVNYSQIVGLVFVLALMIYVTYNDILRL